MKYKSLFLTLFVSGLVFADLPEVKKFKDINTNFFEDFFVYEYGESDGSEVVLSLSHTFLKGFDINCDLSVDIEVFNDSRELVKFTQIATVSLREIKISSAEKQRFYVGGMGKNVTIRLSYEATKCNTKKSENLSFRFYELERIKGAGSRGQM